MLKIGFKKTFLFCNSNGAFLCFNSLFLHYTHRHTHHLLPLYWTIYKDIAVGGRRTAAKSRHVIYTAPSVFMLISHLISLHFPSSPLCQLPLTSESAGFNSFLTKNSSKNHFPAPLNLYASFNPCSCGNPLRIFKSIRILVDASF